MRKKYIIIFIFIPFFSKNLLFGQGNNSIADSIALLEFYDSIRGPSSSLFWDPSQPMDTWDGISLNGQRRVDAIELSMKSLSGSIPDVNLPHLEVLNLSHNTLTGIIPNFTHLSNLTHLDLNTNDLEGTVHNFNLPNLDYLNLARNHLIGTIPSFTLLGNLQTLWVYSNEFEHVQSSFSHIQSLSSFACQLNKLTFDDILPNTGIPGYSYNPQEMVGVDTSFSVLIGDNFTLHLPIDSGLTTNQYIWSKDGIEIDTVYSNNYHLSNLNTDDAGVYSCEITNPDVPNLTLESHPIIISISQTIPCNPAVDKAALRELFLSTNGSNWTNIRLWNLDTPFENFEGVSVNASGCVDSLQLSNKNLTGRIPDLNLPNLVYLDLSFNQIEDDLPNFNYLRSIETLLLNENRFSRKIPAFDNLRFRKLETLDISDNQLTFDDILPNIGVGLTDLGCYCYGPQDSVGTIFTATFHSGDDYILHIPIDSSLTSNTYTWKKNGIFLDSTIDNSYTLINPDSTDAGIYTCSITNSEAPNLTLYSRPITLQYCDFQSSISPPLITSACEGDSIMLEGAEIPDGLYQWLRNDEAIPGQTRRHIYATQSGNYSLVITAGICQDTSDYQNISIYSPPELDLGADTLLCDGNILTLNPGLGQAQYQWSNQSTNSTLDVSEAGTYWVEALINSCWVSDSIIVQTGESPHLDNHVDTTVEICRNASSMIGLDQDRYTNYIWSTGENHYTIEVDQAGDYTLFAEDLNGCGMDMIEIRVIEKDCDLTIHDVITPNGDGFNDQFMIQGLSQYPENEIIILNRLGQIIYQTKNYQNDWGGMNQGKTLPSDTYFYLLFRFPGDVPLKGSLTILNEK